MTDLTFRRPTEADHPGLVSQVDEWWAGRKIHQLLPRLWFRHFSETSWLAEDAGGRTVGFLVGFISQDRPDEAYIHLAGVGPNHRRAGIGRELYSRFCSDVAGRGVRHVSTVTWPGNRASVLFHRALGFTVQAGPGTQNLYGTQSYPDYDAEGDDRVVFNLEL